ncbi:MAG TPA: hypothetical protein VLB80_02350 [Candidatus Babeliales bacterium]|nr:hypothetical protein [Candidatus Babeliales bacterium]
MTRKNISLVALLAVGSFLSANMDAFFTKKQREARQEAAHMQQRRAAEGTWQYKELMQLDERERTIRTIHSVAQKNCKENNSVYSCEEAKLMEEILTQLNAERLPLCNAATTTTEYQTWHMEAFGRKSEPYVYEEENNLKQ